jgi:hypothetical protein
MSIIVVCYSALLVLGYLLPEELALPFRMLEVPLLFFVYAFHRVGIPGVLEQNGLCGWGWCEPTLFGWLLTVVCWLVVAYILARYIVWVKN